MDRYLSENSILKTDSGSYTIQKLIGTGNSCAVYFARRTEENSGAVTEHIIKEYNPSFMAMVRDEDGTLAPANDTDKARERFEQGRERFLEACRRQAELRSEHEALKNSTVNLQHTFDANGTSYADSTSFNGCTYDAVQENSLHDMLRRFRAIAKIAGEYHKAGYLHLDIKPENILALNDTKELVMMFDFDSVVPMAEINGTAMLSCSRRWAAPELERGDRGSISPATDLYALGEMLFERIMGRHSTFMEHRSFSKYSFDSRSELFRNIDPRVFALLTDVFRKTLNSSPARRYSCADELIEVLDRLVMLTRPETQYLRSNLPVMDVFFTGREREIAEIHEALSQQNVVFLSGVGGIGKSELARHYAMQYRDCYDTVVFAHYTKPSQGDPESGILRMLTNDQEVPVANFRRFDGENNAEYFERKLKMLGDICSDSGERVLFILDNMDTMDDADLDRLLSVGCRMIVTTRCDLSEFYRQIDVGTLVNVRDIFRHYYTNRMDEEQLEAEAEILEYFEHHTLGVELAARSLVSGRKKPTELMEMLRRNGASQSGKEKVRVKKDAALSNATMFEHIRMLFDVSGLTDDEKYVMANMSLLPVSGIPEEDLYQLCQLESYNEINSLKENGWLRRFPDIDSCMGGEVDFIALHPLVADAAMELLKEAPERADSLLLELGELIDSREYRFASRSERGASAEYCVGIADRVRMSDICTEAAAFYLSRQPHSIVYGVPNKANILRAAQIFEKIKDNKASKRLIDIAEALISPFFNEKECYNITEKLIRYNIELHGEYSYRTAKAYRVFAYNLGDIGEYDERVTKKRIKAYDKALEIYEKYGDREDDVLRILCEKSRYCYPREESIERLKALQEQYKDNDEALYCIYRSLRRHYDYGSDEFKMYSDLMGDNTYTEVDISEKWNDMTDLQRADHYFRQEEYDKAIPYYEKAFEAADGSDIRHFFEISKYADICFLQGNISRAEELFVWLINNSIEHNGEIHNDIAELYAEIGGWYKKNNIYDKALEYYERQMRIHDTIGKGHEYYFSLHEMGEIYKDIAEYEKALECFWEAADDYYDSDNAKDKADITERIAETYCGMEKYDEALFWYDKLLDIGISADDISLQYLAYTCSGIVLLSMEDIDAALDALYKADALDTNGCYGVFTLHYRFIANAYFMLGKEHEASEALENMIRRYNEEYEFDPSTYATVLCQAMLACCDFRRSPEVYWYNTEYAEKYLREAYECYTENDIICDDLFDCVEILGDLLLELKRYDEAEQLMLKWVEQSHEDHILRNTLAKLYDAIGKPELAEKYRIKE